MAHLLATPTIHQDEDASGEPCDRPQKANRRPGKGDGSSDSECAGANSDHRIRV
jgi:hypothetical protein